MIFCSVSDEIMSINVMVVVVKVVFIVGGIDISGNLTMISAIIVMLMTVMELISFTSRIAKK